MFGARADSRVRRPVKGGATGVKRWVRRRWGLARLFEVVPARIVVALVLALLAGALAPAATALATGWLVARVAEVADGASTDILIAPLAVTGAMIAYQLTIDAVIEPVNIRARDRIDGAIRRRTRIAVGNRPGIEHLEDQAYRNLAELPTVDWDSIGTAAVGQLQVITRYTSALASTAIVASVAPLAAAIGFAILVAKRLFLRGIYAPYQSDMGAHLMPELRVGFYWRDVATSLAGAKELRVFGFSPTAIQRFDDHGSAQARLYEHVFRRSSYAAWPAWIAVVAATALPAWVVVQAALDGDVSVGRLATVISAVLGMQVIGGVGNETFMVEAALTSVESLDRLESLSEQPVPRAPRRSTSNQEWRPPTITFDDVAFTYPTADVPVFEHLSLTLEPGTSVAIVGENGVGKSTLIKLLARFYEPTGGRILADGVDIATLPVEEWRSRLAVVFQGFKRLPLSARHNIALADWHHPERDRLVEAAVEGSGARDLIDALPSGLDTVLSRAYRGGAELSGGQWQRIALARCLYAASVGADVLVLDEPTAHLDVSAEVALFDQLLTHSKGKTAIVVSHRYSTVRRAERIIVLAGGAVIEDGTHAELVALGGTYAGLYALQASAFTAGLT